MKSLDKDGRELEEVVAELLDVKNSDDIKDVKEIRENNQLFIAKIKLNRLKGELKKYVTRKRMYFEQIAYLKRIIAQIEVEHPELKIEMMKI